MIGAVLMCASAHSGILLEPREYMKSHAWIRIVVVKGPHAYTV
jgi:hypothetical protein